MFVHLCNTPEDKNLAIHFRQKHFFDERGILDPYTSTFDQEQHKHFILEKEGVVIGYVHIQYWPPSRAALRIIVIDKKEQGKGYGSFFMHWCENELREDGIETLHTEAHPSALKFYESLGYIPMPFDDPEGHPTHPQDIPMGKKL